MQEYESIYNVLSELLRQHLRQPQKNRNYREVWAEGGFKGKIKKSHFNGEEITEISPKKSHRKPDGLPFYNKIVPRSITASIENCTSVIL